MESVRIGKFTLESLTTGMYADSRIIFREYIQNATDAIDAAIRKEIIKPEEGRINININEQGKRISIKDNGVGIPDDKVWHLLGDIGNSEKRFEENRGFRGIGRLGGLSYANELQFITSAKGESTQTIYYWDCKRLRELLQPGKFMDYDLTRVMDEISVIDTAKEDEEKHYFEVILDGIDEKYPELLDIQNIGNYLSQVAPVPFNAQRFPYYFDKQEGILTELKKINKQPEEYNIYLNDDPNPICKPYKTWFAVDKKSKKDEIIGVEFFKEYNNNELLFWGWYAKTNWLGTVIDKNIKGLRVRKNNILIGDENTLNDFFTQTRFNGWFIGEVYVYEKNIIPNARRDYFEKNEEYRLFRKELEKLTKQVLSKLPPKYSDDRKEKKNIEEAEKTIHETIETLGKGITSEIQREELFNKIDSIKSKVQPKQIRKTNEKSANDKGKDITKVSEKDDNSRFATVEKKEKVFSELLKLENKVIDADVYRTKNIPSSYTKEVKKVIRLVFEVIDSTLPKEQAESLIDRIIERLKVKPKGGKK